MPSAAWPPVRRCAATGLALVLIMVLVACTEKAATVTVMTRNLYLGADITRPIFAATGRTGADAARQLGYATRAVESVVQMTDFSVRSRLLAAEIADAKPDLIGLQEVALWRRGPLVTDPGASPSASVVDQDFLAILLGDLAARGTPYDLVATKDEADVESPSVDKTAAGPTDHDLRLTLRDVILVSRGSAVHVLGTDTGSYGHILNLNLAGTLISFARGWVSADVQVGNRKFRFVTTHLESQRADIAAQQADELVAGPAAGAPLVVVCDCNSDPNDSSIASTDSVPGSAAYTRLIGAGLADGWLVVPGHGSGETGVLGERVDDPLPDFTRRLDLVLTKSDKSVRFTPTAARLTGNEAANRDPTTGLWPSDHAGVVLTLQLD